MKKRFTYILLLIIFFSATAFVVIRYNGKGTTKLAAFYPLQERKGLQAQLTEWASTLEKAKTLIRMVKENPDDIKTALSLSSLYLQEARITGNFTYYNKAALHYVENVLEKDPNNFEAYTLKAVIELSQHHFADAIETANRASAINPYSAFLQGILVDGYLEMGNYKAAIESADKMVSIRPDLRSYSRISYLREIHGDYNGAIEAMTAAVDAGMPGDEQTEWARVQLAHLYELTGDLKRAEMYYTIALDQRPAYAPAIAGMGNIAYANKDYAKAITLYTQADTLLTDYSYKEKIAAVYIHSGQQEKGMQMVTAIINTFKKDAEEGEESIAHHADKELAYVYLLGGNSAKALQHALAEYNRRPDNIDVNEAVAWAYYNNGEAQKALPFINKALSTGLKNPELNCRAAVIFAKAGENEKAKTLLQQALRNNPNINAQLLQQSQTLLKSL